MHKTTKNLVILGSTGSIGTQTLEVLEGLEKAAKDTHKVQNAPETQDPSESAKKNISFNVLGMSCGSNIELFIEQIKKFCPKKVCVGSKEGAKEVKSIFPNLEVLCGEEGLIELADDKNADIMLTGTSGCVALKPTLKAIENGTDIALANKETLVMAGDIVTKAAKANGVNILPVDSEHSAILQSSNGNYELLNKIIITASGGPFLHKSRDEIKNATFKEALNHPRWHMGKKITIDSATLMNKGLEVIEAHHLFNLPYEKIEVVIHPESLVHSAVEFKDGSTVAQIGTPSMHIPIQYALTYPSREYGIKSNSFSFLGQTLTFEKPDFEKFPCLKLAFEAGKTGGTLPVVLNAANEIAVHKFLRGEIGMGDIFKIVERETKNHTPIQNPTLDEIFEADKETRQRVLNDKTR